MPSEMRTPLIIVLLLSSQLVTPGAMRAWRNAEGSKSFQAEYLSSDGARVTLKRRDGRIITLAIKVRCAYKRLHAWNVEVCV